jgi:glycosyltransferase involved in cell wall biosynthesis
MEPEGEGPVISNRRVIVVLPAYNAARTLEKTYREIPFDVVDDVILVDDASRDETVRRAAEIGIRNIIVHPSNRGYGANQKSCYRKALELGADIVVMLHPDYQYTPKLIPAMVSLISSELYDIALGSRILGVGALQGGMPLYKYVSNRILTLIQNRLLGYKLSEYHTGFRAFSRRVLETLPLEENGDDFVFDNEMLTQAIYFGYRIAEVTCPTLYGPESSSISFRRSVRYGLGVLETSLRYRVQKMGWAHYAFLDAAGRKLAVPALPTSVIPAVEVADLAAEVEETEDEETTVSV